MNAWYNLNNITGRMCSARDTERQQLSDGRYQWKVMETFTDIIEIVRTIFDEST